MFEFLVFLAASVPVGAFGYGFSTLAVPLLLFWRSNREVVPLVNFVEVFQNFLLLLGSREEVGRVWGAVWPLLVGLGPGVALGVYVLLFVDVVLLKFFTYLVLVPLVLLQLADFRRPLAGGRWAGFFVGVGAGVLYASTTISGPLLAVLFSNNGLVRGEFRAAMAIVRSAESLAAFIGYVSSGLFAPWVVYAAAVAAPFVVLGLVLGKLIASFLDAVWFRRALLEFDLLLVGWGLSGASAALGASETFSTLLFVLVASLGAIFVFRWAYVDRAARR